MYKLSVLSSSALQEVTLVLPDGVGEAIMTLYFVELQQGWFITKLTYEDFVLENFRVCNSLNMLHQFRNILPFGLACYSVNDREPSLIEDFSSENSVLYMLTEDEVAEVNGIITGG